MSDLGEATRLYLDACKRTDKAEAEVERLLTLLEPFAVIGRELITQDNRMTCDAMFCVDVPNADKPGSYPRRVAVCFTQGFADEFLRVNGHNFERAYVYVDSGNRNREWRLMRQAMIAAAEGTQVETTKAKG